MERALCYKVLQHMPEPAHESIHEHAVENLRYIRSAMERAGTFTAVPGRGTIAVGLTALVAAWVAGGDVTSARWLNVWLIEAAVAAIISAAAIVIKARAASTPLTSAPARRFALAFLPALVAGGILSFVFWKHGLRTDIAPMWLLLYGTAVMAGGALSVRIVPVMGTALAVLGAVSFLLPVTLQPLTMALGFGVLHIVFGAMIARYHGG